MDVFSNALRRAEILLAVVLMGLSLFHTGQMAIAMATSSLSTDEFGTVGSFSSKGPATVITDYRAPKNHVFFNLLNSLLPGRESLATTRVRALSILATILTALALIAYATWRGRWLEGAVLLALWSSAPQTLELSMEARGYGFLGLFAVLATVAVIEYFRDRDRRWLWVLGVSVTLGVYTVPGFLFFAGPLMLLLWAVERTRVTFFAGLLTVAAILLLYSPLLLQVYSAFTGFHQDKPDEADFQNTHALIRAVKLYLFQSEDWVAWLLLAAMGLVPFVPGTHRREKSALRIVSGACIACLVALLALRTPPLRMAAFCLLPMGIAGAWSVGGWMRDRLPLLLRVAICGSIGGVLICELMAVIRPFRFAPTEDWSLAARAIDTAFPPNIHVEFRRYAKYLRQTLPDAGTRSGDYDPTSFGDGRLIVAYAGNKWAENGGGQFVPPRDVRAVKWTIPGSIRDIVLYYCPPATPGLNAPTDLMDGRMDTGVDLSPGGLELHGNAGAGAKALIVLLNRPPTADELQIDAPNNPYRALFAGNAIVVPLEPGTPFRVHLRTTKDANLNAVEAWVTQ